MRRPDRTYSRYDIVSLVTAPPGWSAAFKDENQNIYFMDVACFALAKEEVRRYETNEPLLSRPPRVFAVVTAGDEPMIAAEFANYCGVYGPNTERPARDEHQMFIEAERFR